MGIGVGGIHKMLSGRVCFMRYSSVSHSLVMSLNGFLFL
jgi:hypothetical protein